MITELLNKDDIQKVALVSYLEKQPHFFASLKQINQELKLSVYLLKKLIEALEVELENFGMEVEVSITIEKQNVFLFQSDRCSSDILLELFLRKSMKFELLKLIFFGQLDSINEFVEKNYISRTSVYRMLKEIKHFLKGYEINLTRNNELVGDEMSIRQLFATLFHLAYKGSFDLYMKSFQSEMYQLFNYMRIKKENSRVSLSKHYVLVTLTRISQSKHSRLNKKYYPLSNPANLLGEKMLLWVRQQGIEEKWSIFELNGLMGNCLLNETNFVQMKDQHIDRYNRQLSEMLGCIGIESAGVESELSRVFLEYGYVRKYADFENRVVDMGYFYERYPKLFRVCLDYVRLLMKENKEFQYNNKTFFFELLLILINNLSVEIMSPTINIYVDFTQGDHYNYLIQQNICSFHYFNIQFHEKVLPQTDLILTDYQMEQAVMKKTVLWLSPPRASDWGKLGEYIFRISKEKAQKIN